MKNKLKNFFGKILLIVLRKKWVKPSNKEGHEFSEDYLFPRIAQKILLSQWNKSDIICVQKQEDKENLKIIPVQQKKNSKIHVGALERFGKEIPIAEEKTSLVEVKKNLIKNPSKNSRKHNAALKQKYANLEKVKEILKD